MWVGLANSPEETLERIKLSSCPTYKKEMVRKKTEMRDRMQQEFKFIYS